MKSVPIVIIVLVVILGAFWLLAKANIVDSPFSNLNNQNNNQATTTIPMKLTSPGFVNGDFIGSKYSCDEPKLDGTHLSPPLLISGVPAEAKSLVLIMDDPDVPKQVRPEGVFDHWVVYNIPVGTTFIDEGQVVG